MFDVHLYSMMMATRGDRVSNYYPLHDSIRYAYASRKHAGQAIHYVRLVS